LSLVKFKAVLFHFVTKAATAQGEADSLLTLRGRLMALRQLPPLFRLIWSTSRRMTLASLFTRLLSALIPPAILYVGKLIIDEVVRLTTLENFGDRGFLWKLIAIEFGLVLLSELLGRVTVLLDGLLGDALSNATSVRMIEHAGQLDLGQFENPTFYDKLDRARNRTPDRVRLMSQALTQTQTFVSSVFLSIGLSAYSLWFVLILLLFFLPAFIAESQLSVLTYSLTLRWTPERRELDYLRWTSASLETAREVKIFGLANFLKERFRALSDRFFSVNRDLVVRRTTWSALFSLVGVSGLYLAIVVVLLKTVRGELSVGDLSFLVGSFARLRESMQSLLLGIASMVEGALYTKDLFDFFSLQPQVRAPHSPRPFPRPIKHGFSFENVSFRYPDTRRMALCHVSFTLHAGETLALVGANGSGKSTLVKLLSRFYDPDEGRIVLDGYDLRDYDPVELHREIGIVFQDFVRYQMTAAENIAVGRIEALNDLARIKRASRHSLANIVIEKLPFQYHQLIGRRFGGGVDLSGGEWQKIALARAYMRDAQLILLDEPTAALDPETEYEILRQFADLVRGRTAVLISHRLSAARMADRIMLLENGRCLEIGSHQELLNRNGRYARIFAIQAEGYR
jgi:ATP-binding cassette, subfamily B, bacterial